MPALIQKNVKYTPHELAIIKAVSEKFGVTDSQIIRTGNVRYAEELSEEDAITGAEKFLIDSLTARMAARLMHKPRFPVKPKRPTFQAKK